MNITMTCKGLWLTHMPFSGGIYVDLDFDSYKPLTPFLQQHGGNRTEIAFVGRGSIEGIAPTTKENLGIIQNSMPNAFMASTRGHPFWERPLHYAKKIWYESNELRGDGKSPIQMHVESVTGPVALYQSASAYNAAKTAEDPALFEISPKYIYPFMWYQPSTDGQPMLSIVQAKDGFDLEAIRKRYNDGIAFACTYWASSWKPDDYDDK